MTTEAERERIARMAWRFAGHDRHGGPFYEGAKPSDSPAMQATFAFADAILSSPPCEGGEPVAWRVKDFADGWILFHDEVRARREAEGAGNLVQPLYAHPAPAVEVGRDIVRAAYLAGATAVHDHWVANPGINPAGDHDPEFGEAADDYAALATPVPQSEGESVRVLDEGMREALVRADRIVKWMSDYVGTMCPPDGGLFDLNEHWFFMERRLAALSAPQSEDR